MSLVLDTNALLWSLENDHQLGARARQAIEHASQTGQLMVSAASYWEVAMLVVKGRLAFHRPVHQWRLDAIRSGIEEVPIDGELAVESVTLSGLHGDPMDRLIVATAIRMQATLVTSDARLLSWKGPLACIDARV